MEVFNDDISNEISISYTSLLRKTSLRGASMMTLDDISVSWI